MPLTYISALIASLSISGVPPFNGFVSKWMVYPGLINQLQVNDYGLRITAILCLAAAMFGSGLTLASFMKLSMQHFESTHEPNELKATQERSCLDNVASLC